MNAVCFICATFLSVLLVLAGNVSANSYNDGFIDAESGKYKSALSHWGPLADEGHPLAQFNVGLLYHSGDGVGQDEVEAIVWYKKSAENGYYKAQEYLAAGYAEGWFGLNKDVEKAKYWNDRIESGN